jgi:hypothetical protein
MNEKLNGYLLQLENAASTAWWKIVAAIAYLGPKVLAAFTWVTRKAKAAWQSFLTWLAPAEDSIRGEINMEELKRAMMKATASFAAAKVSVTQWLHETGLLETLVGPACVGLAVFLIDGGRRRYLHGERPGETMTPEVAQVDPLAPPASEVPPTS